MTEILSFKDYINNKYIIAESANNDVENYKNDMFGNKAPTSPDLALDPDDDATVIKFKANLDILANTSAKLKDLAKGLVSPKESRCFDVFKGHKTTDETQKDIDTLSKAVKDNKDAINAADTISGKVNKKTINAVGSSKEILKNHKGDIITAKEDVEDSEDILLEISRLVGGLRRGSIGLQSNDRIVHKNDYLSQNRILDTIQKQSNKTNSYKNLDKVFSTAEHGSDDSKISKDGGSSDNKGQKGNRVFTELTETTNKKIDVIAGRLSVSQEISEANKLLNKLSNPNLKQYYTYVRQQLIKVQSILTSIWSKIKTASYNIGVVLDGYSGSVDKVTDTVNKKFSDIQAYSNKEHTKLNSQINKVEAKLSKKAEDPVSDKDLDKSDDKNFNKDINTYKNVNISSVKDVYLTMKDLYKDGKINNKTIDNMLSQFNNPIDKTKALCFKYILLKRNIDKVKFNDSPNAIIKSMNQNINYHSDTPKDVLTMFKHLLINGNSVKNINKKPGNSVLKDLDFIEPSNQEANSEAKKNAEKNTTDNYNVAVGSGATNNNISDTAAYKENIESILKNKNIDDIHKAFYYYFTKDKRLEGVTKDFKFSKIKASDINKLKILFLSYLIKNNDLRGTFDFAKIDIDKKIEELQNITDKDELKNKFINTSEDTKVLLDDPSKNQNNEDDQEKKVVNQAKKFNGIKPMAAQNFEQNKSISIFDLALQKAKQYK